jgi:hypothetical protein
LGMFWSRIWAWSAEMGPQVAEENVNRLVQARASSTLRVSNSIRIPAP